MLVVAVPCVCPCSPATALVRSPPPAPRDGSHRQRPLLPRALLFLLSCGCCATQSVAAPMLLLLPAALLLLLAAAAAQLLLMLPLLAIAIVVRVCTSAQPVVPLAGLIN
ncbi:hypothetical protein ZWY2020_005533 [Hordeum vulgare]|nr:hypothetical protein ZWY2020_005533 [Hordeum vulgare]